MKSRLAKVSLFGNAAKAATVNLDATNGAQIGSNLLLPDGSLGTVESLRKLFGSTAAPASINTTDDLEEGQWHLWFTDRRAQDAVGSILANSATVSLAYVGGRSITATLNDLADSGAGAALVKLTRDAKGRISGTSAASTTDLTEGSNLYYTDTRADARITLQKAQPLGLATLDAGGKLDAGQLPALAISETFVVNTQAAMLALAAEEGDVAVRTDLSKSFILTAAPATTLANWQELLTPASPVTSIFGRVGSVVAASGDYTFAQIGSKPTTLVGYGITDAESSIAAGTATQYWRGDKSWQTLNKAAVGLGSVDNTSDAGKPVSTAQAAAIALKADSSSVVHLTGAENVAGSKTFTNNVTIATGSYPAFLFKDTANVTDKTSSLFYLENGTGDFLLNIINDANTVSYARVRLARLSPGFGPDADNGLTCGFSAARWSVVYAATGAINTSDARDKTSVVPLSDAEISAAADLARAIGTYQWLAMVTEKGAGDARHHAGLTVQRAIEIMQSHGLDPFAYGFICYDQWDELPEVVRSWPAQDAVLDADGNVVTPAVDAGSEIQQPFRPAGDRYSFRTDELLLFMARGFDARLTALESA